MLAFSSAARSQTPPSFKDCDLCPEMVTLPAGKFLMGASKEDKKFTDSYTIGSELPQHDVTIAYSFAIAKFELTVAEFAAYVAETGVKTGGDCDLRTPDTGPNAGKYVGTLKQGAEHYPPSFFVITDGDFRRPGGEVSDKHPAACISRREAKAYLEWLSKKTGKPYRFPTEAEWEYAVRAGNPKPFHFGSGPKDLCPYANFADRKSPYHSRAGSQCAEEPSPLMTAPVGSYRPNSWGLHDMLGNAFEFMEDCSSANYNDAPTDGSPYGRGSNCDKFASRSYNYDSMPSGMRSAARCAIIDWDGRGNNLTIRAAVSLDDNAWDRR
ncbi:MAG: formylglycine-generating enzyme family protein [Hyphomicrobium sp.]